jgi:nicotinamidase-related amidase
MPCLDPATTALVLIDLQQGIVAMDTAPRPSGEVVETCRALADEFRSCGAPVATVHVGWAEDGADRPSQRVDRPMQVPEGGLPPHWSAFVEGVHKPGDIAILKHHWGAFTGTELDLQLRRRHVKTVVIAGIATNMGVESTARSAWELGYDVVIVEDACASRSAEMHAFAIESILPSIARVVQAKDVLLTGATPAMPLADPQHI